MSIAIRIAGTARRLFQPTVGELKNSQTGSVVPLWGSNFGHISYPLENVEMSLLLGIDLGTTKTTCIAVDSESGEVVASVAKPTGGELSRRTGPDS